eukprot:6172098-Pleurochrysis_carterae.AAC.1
MEAYILMRARTCARPFTPLFSTPLARKTNEHSAFRRRTRPQARRIVATRHSCMLSDAAAAARAQADAAYASSLSTGCRRAEPAQWLLRRPANGYLPPQPLSYPATTPQRADEQIRVPAQLSPRTLTHTRARTQFHPQADGTRSCERLSHGHYGPAQSKTRVCVSAPARTQVHQPAQLSVHSHMHTRSPRHVHARTHTLALASTHVRTHARTRPRTQVERASALPPDHPRAPSPTMAAQSSQQPQRRRCKISSGPVTARRA